MSKRTKITFEDGRPAPFTQPGEPIIRLKDGVPPLGTAAFKEHLKEWHARHNGAGQSIPFRLTEQGQRAVEGSQKP